MGSRKETDFIYWSKESIDKLPSRLRNYVDNSTKGEVDGDGEVKVDLLTLPTEVQKCLILEPNIPEPVRSRLLDWAVRQKAERPDWRTKKVKSQAEFFKIVSTMLHNTPGFALEVEFNGRWYPIMVNIDSFQSFFGGLIVSLKANFKVGPNMSHEIKKYITSKVFESDTGDPIERPVIDVLVEQGFRPLMTDPKDFYKKVRLAQEMSESEFVGAQRLVTSTAVHKVQYSWWTDVESLDFGTEESPRKVVIEPDLEQADHDDRRGYGWYGNDDDGIILPYVRVFALDMKKYVYVDVDDLIEYSYDDQAIDRLVLPPDMGQIIRTVFTTPVNKLFGDVLASKHGGMVVLAAGGPGVGKTLTAEVFAEHTHRPLYVLEVGELGTTPEDVEENLQRVFKRATRWNAVLLFDEADIFMAKRDKNLERNAIVGIFLRLLDYYPGLMFLTTNRADIMDDAFKSRITLALEYPALNRKSKTKIWNNFFKLASITLLDEMGPIDVESTSIPDLPVNGRQIRNMIRLISLVHGGAVTVGQVNELFNYTCKIGSEASSEEVFEEELNNPEQET